MSLQPGTSIGKYLVRRKLAEGGMAEIYLCSVQGPEGFDKEVVIKRVRSFLADDPGFVQMFIAEAQLASRLNHANLVQIFDFDKHEDTYYLAMEYVKGHSLWDIRRQSKALMVPMPPTLAAYLCTEVARGLGFAHRLTERGVPLGLVHRDVTPQNVLVSWDGAVKLTDFGIARRAGQRLTTPGMLKGKFAYMSPEQARGDEVDARSDVFSLGVVLWELITGGRLFEGDSDVAVLKAVQKSIIPPPARLNPDVNEGLDAIVMKALARELESRYQSAQELERALAQHVLTEACSVDETDLPAYLRRLFPEQPPEPGPSGYEDTLASAGPPSTSPGAKEEHTTNDRVPSSVALSPDDDPDGSTLVVAGAQPDPVEPREVQTAPAQERVPTVVRAQQLPLPPPGTGITWLRRGGLVILGLCSMTAGAAVVVRFASPELPPPVAIAAPATAAPATAAPATAAPATAAPATAAPATAAPATAAPGPSAVTVATAVPKRPGTLVVRAVPWANLFIDGKPRGEIDPSRRRISLPPGAHTVVFQHPRGSRTFSVTIESERDLVREFNATR